LLEPWTELAHAEEWVKDRTARPDTRLYSVLLKLEHIVSAVAEPQINEHGLIPDAATTIGLIGVTRGSHLTYLLHPDYWGRGLMTEALQVFLPAWVLHFSDLSFLEAVIAEDNVRSRRVLEKCGFSEDSTQSERRSLSELEENALKAAVQGLGLITKRSDVEARRKKTKRNKYVIYYVYFRRGHSL